ASLLLRARCLNYASRPASAQAPSRSPTIDLVMTAHCRLPVQVHIEVTYPDARLALPGRPRATVEWCDLPPGAFSGHALVATVRGVDLVPGTQVWVAGEASAVQRIRRHLFEDRGLPRALVRRLRRSHRSAAAQDL